MGSAMADLVSIASMFIGLATLTVLVRNASGTSSVIQAASQGFGSVLNTAMGGGISGNVGNLSAPVSLS